MKSADAGAYFDKLARRMQAADGAGVEYGLTDAPHPSGMTAAQLGRRLHEGDAARNLPARPFHHDAEDIVRTTANRPLKRAVLDIIHGKDIERALQPVADLARDALVQAIDDFSDPANAPSTIRRKGRNDPLVDVGEMRDAAGAVVVMDAGADLGDD